jgi:hypothetical protein
MNGDFPAASALSFGWKTMLALVHFPFRKSEFLTLATSGRSIC